VTIGAIRLTLTGFDNTNGSNLPPPLDSGEARIDPIQVKTSGTP